MNLNLLGENMRVGWLNTILSVNIAAIVVYGYSAGD